MSDIEFNPWNVLSLEAFHFYCCPECESKYGTKGLFVEHATSTHPKARETIMTILDSNVTISSVQPIPVLEQDEIKVECSDVDPISGEFQQESEFGKVRIKMENIENTEPDFHEVDIKNIINNEKIEPATVEFAEDCNEELYLTSAHFTEEDISRMFRFKCSQCSYTSIERSQLQNHVDTYHIKMKCHEDDVKVFKCDHCPRTSTTLQGLMKHMNSAHKEFGKRSSKYKKKGVLFKNASLYIYECEQCPKKYKKKQDLERHIQSKHEGLSFDCEHCNKSFGNSYTLRMHVSLKHVVTQSFECHLCQKVCNSQTGLDFHMTAHYVDMKMLKCDQCSYTAYKEYDLKLHKLKRHEGFRPPRAFKCEFCEKNFTSKNHLRRHMETIHDMKESGHQENNQSVPIGL